MSNNKKKLPSVSGLKKAQENFKKLYEKRPSGELVKIISEISEDSNEKKDKIAAIERRPRQEIEM